MSGKARELVVLLAAAVLAETAQSEVPTIAASGNYAAGEHTFYCANYAEPETAPRLNIGREPSEGERGRLIDVRVTIQRVDRDRRRTIVHRRDPDEGVCRAGLHEPGLYEITSERTVDSWVWRINPDASSVNVTRLVREPQGSKLERSVYQILVEAVGNTVDEPECRARQSVVIDLPASDALFAFDASTEGVLEIDLAATANDAACEPVEIHWSADQIAGSKQTFRSGDGANSNVGDAVTLVYEGLPENTREFGPKTITASAGGRTTTAAIEVFFDPDATNHAGAGRGETPNWYHYWLQTSASSARNMHWLTPAPGGPPFFAWQVSTLTPRVARYTTSCAEFENSSHFAGNFYPQAMDHINVCPDAREGMYFTATGRRSSAIDTFAIVLVHEWQHKVNFDAWWRRYYEQWYRDPALWSGSWDLEAYVKVHDEVDLQPGELTGNDVPARRWDAILSELGFAAEHDVAWAVQRDWAIGSADAEDWSRCGNQWRAKRTQGCPKVEYLER